MSYSLGELARLSASELHGDGDCRIERVASLETATPGSITFLSNHRLARYLPATDATAVILSRRYLQDCPVSALVTENPYATYAKVAAVLAPLAEPVAGIHPTAVVGSGGQISSTATIGPGTVIGDNAWIGDNVIVGPSCVIGNVVRIGENTRLVTRVTVLDNCRIGRNGLIHPGVVIGADGFGFAQENGQWTKVPQLGEVHIGDDVEIGANTTIDRGAIDNTEIGDGVKIDNQVQIAHNVRIGAHTAIAGCVGIAGNARIGEHCALGGAAGVLGHLEIADHVTVTAMALVTKSIPEPGVYSSGVPLEPNRAWRANAVRFKQLDQLARRLKGLEKILHKKRKPC